MRNEIHRRQPQIEELKQFLTPEQAKSRFEPIVLDLSATELLEKAFNSKIGNKLRALYDGQLNGHKSQSEADQSFCSLMAFWSGGNPSLIDQWFRSSRLYREKWDEKHSADGRTYGEMTIDKALTSCTEFYGTPKKINATGRAFAASSPPNSRVNNGTVPGSNEAKAEQEEEPQGQPWPELDPAALYGLAGDIIRVIEPHTESDPTALLLQTLVVFGNAIGRTAHFVAESTHHYLNLFILLVGLTGKGRKGTSWNHVLRFVARTDELWATHCISSSPSSGEALIWIVRDPIERKEPVREKKGGRVVDYQTVVVDEGVADKRMLVLMTEFASMLRIMSRDGNTVSAVYRQLWDSDHIVRVNNKNTPVKVTGPHLSSIGHITKDEYLRNVDETDKVNGFANRLLHAMVRRSKCLPEGGSLKESDLNELVQRFRAALQFGCQVHELRRDEAAADLWRDVYPRLSEGHRGMFGAVTSRAEAQTMRLACIYALLDCSPVIRYVHLKAALALWKYCEDSARYVFGDALGDRLADEILAALREAAEVGLTRSQIRDIFRRNVDADRIGSALRSLAENGLAQTRKEPTEGRPVERWFALTQRAQEEADDDAIIAAERRAIEQEEPINQ